MSQESCERHGQRRWFIFGESADGKLVDVSDGDEDVLQSIPRTIAVQIIAARDKFCDLFEEIPA